MSLKSLLPLALLLAAAGAPAQTPAEPLRFATWNLGWHLDAAAAKTWVAACNQPFTLQGALWKPGSGEGSKPAWDLPWGRNAPIEWDIGQQPPCDSYQVGQGAERQTLHVSEAQYLQRNARIAGFIRERLQPDVMAFQEVSGAQAVRELMGPDYEVCSYEGHKVQRVAIAWKRSLGAGRCEVHWPLALPAKPMKEQVRPGLALTLQRDGRTLKVLTVHLKSSCVSLLEDQVRTPGRGQLDGDETNCQQLQAQVEPLKAWVAEQARGADALVMLGDFNRDLNHEAGEPADAPLRAANGRTRNLLRTLNAASPKPLTLLGAQCEGGVAGLCSLGKRQPLARDDYGKVRAELGCRNPLGLDHVLLAGAAHSREGVFKQALGADGVTRADALALSDHCPVLGRIALSAP